MVNLWKYVRLKPHQDIIFATGYSKVSSKLSLHDREELCSILIDYHCILKTKAAMDHFLEGLSLGGLSKNVLQIPSLKHLFVHDENKLTLGW